MHDNLSVVIVPTIKNKMLKTTSNWHCRLVLQAAAEIREI
jgi:hypothetical protein